MKTQDNNHISDETLAAFIDNNLDGKERDDVMLHLVECDECREVAMEVSQMSTEQKKKYSYANVIMNYIAPVALVASVMLVVIVPMVNQNDSDGLISPNQQITPQFRDVSTEDTDRAFVIDSDDYAFCSKEENNITDNNLTDSNDTSINKLSN